MIATTCKHDDRKKHGKDAKGNQRYRCRDCGVTFIEETNILAGMRIGLDRAEMIIKCLVEGMSVRATARLTDTDPHTIIDLMMLVGDRCKQFLDRELKDVVCDDIQIDEVWQYIGAKQKTAKHKELGDEKRDSYCYTAIERNTKLLVCWHFGKRDSYHTEQFCEKLRDAVAGRFHLSSDGFGPYKTAVPFALAGRIDYGMLIKIFGNTSQEDQRKYSPAAISSIKKEAIWGNPQDDRICTSHCELAQLEHADFQPPHDSADERIQQEMGEPRSNARPVFHALQLREGSRYFENHSSGRIRAG